MALGSYSDRETHRLLLPAPPSSTKAAGIGSPTGTVSLDQAAKVYGRNNSTGYLKGWDLFQVPRPPRLDSSGVLTQIDLYQFGSEALAFEWLADQRGFLETDPTIGTRSYLPKIANGRYYVQLTPAKAPCGTRPPSRGTTSGSC